MLTTIPFTELIFGGGPLELLGEWILSIFRSLDTLILITKSPKASSETWGNENLCLLTDTEYYDMEGMNDERKRARAIDKGEKRMNILRTELGKDGGMVPVIEHRWLYPHWEEAEEVVDTHPDEQASFRRTRYVV